MTQLIHVYANGHARILTVTGVTPGDAEGSALVETVDDGAVAVTSEDTPELFLQLRQAGLL
jgi:hypothetical protein